MVQLGYLQIQQQPITQLLQVLLVVIFVQRTILGTQMLVIKIVRQQQIMDILYLQQMDEKQQQHFQKM
jgi:hypothetical protein